MSETEASAGLFSMPTLSMQYNEEGWGPHEISEDFRVMPYQVHFSLMHSVPFSLDSSALWTLQRKSKKTGSIKSEFHISSKSVHDSIKIKMIGRLKMKLKWLIQFNA